MGTSTDQSPSQNKRTFWQNHINQWQASGQSQRHYCSKNHLNTHTFSYWKKKLLPKNRSVHTEETSISQQSAFIPVQAQRHTREELTSGITLSLPNGCQLSGINEHNVAVVKRLAEWL